MRITTARAIRATRTRCPARRGDRLDTDRPYAAHRRAASEPRLTRRAPADSCRPMGEPASVLESPVLSEEYVLDPYPIIARLRTEDPLHFVPGIGFWMVTRYDDVRRLFTDEDVTNDPRADEYYVPPPEGSVMRCASDD